MPVRQILPVCLSGEILVLSISPGAPANTFAEDYVEIGYWSTIEVPVGVICASMPAIRALAGKIFPKAFGTTRKNTSDYKGFSEHSSNQLRSNNNNSNNNRNSKLPGQGKHIKVKTEWIMYSHHVQEQSNASDVQLVPMAARVSEGGDDSPTSLRPAKNMADMQTICKADREERDDEILGIAK